MRVTVKNSRQGGYTLLEIAVVLLIVGVLAGSFLHIYSIYREQQKIEKTQLSQIRIKFALEDFKVRYGRYPCPASYEDTRDQPATYGYEGNCAVVTVPPGSCSNGYCVELSQRTVSMPDGTSVTPRVRRGALPFRTLMLGEEDLYDAYGGRFSYAVTELLTDWTTFAVTRGGISVVDGQTPAESLVVPAHSGLFFVFSHGKDNIGAYDNAGNLLAACNGTMLDVENCNTSPTERFAVYRDALYSEVPVDTLDASAGGGGGGGGPPPVAVDANPHFDDYTYYDGMGLQPLWRYSEDALHLNDIHDMLGEGDRILLGSTPATQKLNVAGDIRVTPGAEPGNALVDRICGRDGSGDCFPPNLIAGTGTNQCAVFGVGVGNSAITCGTLNDVSVRCSEERGGRFLTGFDANGQIICGDIHMPIPCAARTVDICDSTRVLVESPHGTLIPLTAGASRIENWRCNDGEWHHESESGVCSCTPSETTTGGACGFGYTGTETVTTTTECPSGEVTTNVDRSDCACVGATNVETGGCPWPWVGTQTRTQTFFCNAEGGLEDWWTPWTGNCTCPERAPETELFACDGNMTGSVRGTRTFNTESCTWNAWSYDTSGCSCQVRTEDQTIQCDAPLTGTITQRRTLSCPTGTWGGWTNVAQNCSCENRYEYRQAECPSGQVGERTQRILVNCHGAPVAGAVWQDDTNTCERPPQYYWRIPAGSPSMGTEGGTPRPIENSSCSTPGSSGICFRRLSASLFQRFSQCVCGS